MNLCIVDGNAVGYAAHYAMQLKAGNQDTAAIFGVVRTVIDAKQRHPQSKIIVLWDGKAQWRYDRCPTYKANRKSDDPKRQKIHESYAKQRPFMFEILKSMGVSQFRCTTHEADDLAAIFVKKAQPDDFITLLTSDRDWLQLVRHNVIWVSARDKSIVTSRNFQEVTGYRTPEAFLDGKCLMGDSSDNVCGVGGFGEKGTPAFMTAYASVNNFLQAVDAGVIKPTKKIHQRLASPEGREIYNRNYEVMQLLDPKPIDKANLISTGPADKNADAFIEYCGQFAFQSLAPRANEILSMF